MTRAMWWAPVVLLTLLLIVLGVRQGSVVAALTETDIIEAAADAYRAETGRPRTECQARPGAERVWIVVSCGPYCSDVYREYQATRLGHLTAQTSPCLKAPSI